ncbi:helix-turn-helix transcriptional regulator [Paenibacillus sp. H1-7]|uniref:LuxR family transcriptional regulator n=1 Tax=Paenibacillus sp. H1-7 TaxID=2282849 RepID=UPI001EF7C9FB|nr:LuxR family transcriptional regulator [Paenibacillus sp. H1-7]ULL16281.1 helix-turn-helix transcriptional regulator [Paenibacillus sp. H1-7]
MDLEYNSLAQRENQYIVGREAELERFSSMLAAEHGGSRASVLHIYGTGGLGKSTYLRLCRELSVDRGCWFVLMDSRDFVHTEDEFCSALLNQLTRQNSNGKARVTGGESARERALDWIEQASTERRVIIALDTFEEMIDMEAWMRDRFIPWLPKGTVVLSAGRHPLKGGWITSPVWRELISQLRLPPLDKEECLKYTKLCGIQDAEQMESIWIRSKGHPLTLSLAVASYAYEGELSKHSEVDWFGELASLWLKEYPDRELRSVVEAASVLRRFDQELLSFVMEKEIDAQVVDKLKSLSFVHKSVNGWQLHDLMSEITSCQLKDRAPKLYKRYIERSAIYYAEAILTAAGNKGMAWEIGELFRYAGIKVLKAMARDNTTSYSYYWETVTESSLQDVFRYIEWREQCTEGIFGMETDPDTGEQFVLEYSVEALRYNFSGVDVRALFQKAPESLKLLRDREGRVHALAVIIPIHSETLPLLEEDPLCRPYLNALSAEERSKLEAPRDRPSGWFMRSMDFIDLMNSSARSQGVYLIYAHMCSGGLFVCSPYPSEISSRIYPELGFCIVDNAWHDYYAGFDQTPTYAIDTRGSKLRLFLEGLLKQAGIRWQQAPPIPLPETRGTRMADLMKQFTNREQEVIELVLSGCSNAEVANKLYISEVTVKKHLKSIYAKLGINTRTQLASKMMAESG